MQDQFLALLLSKECSYTLLPAFLSILFALFSLCSGLLAQEVLPVRQDGRWGVIDDNGRMLIEPQYDLLGWPGAGSSLVVQQGGKLGLIGPDGRQLLAARYADIQILDEQLFAVLDAEEWSVRNLNGQTVVAPGYEQLRRLGPGLIAFKIADKWGLSHADGRQLAAPVYDQIERLGESRFLVKQIGKFGVLRADGSTLLPPIAESIEVDSSRQFLFYRAAGRWGGKSLQTTSGFSAQYDNYNWLDEYHLILVGDDRLTIFQEECGQLQELPIGARPISFSNRAIAFRLANRVGLLNTCDQGSLAAEYLEVQPFTRNCFRARTGSGWGLVGKGNSVSLAFNYDYISPLKNGLALVYNNDLIGFVNGRGRLLKPPTYARIEQEGSRWQAYTSLDNGASLTTFELDDNGELKETAASSSHFRIQVAGRSPETSNNNQRQTTLANRILPRHEWFYAADQDRWGLRLRGGQEVLPPTFSRIEIDQNLGVTLVGLPKTTELAFERTTYRANEVFGLLLNEEGKVVTELNLLHLELDDWRAGNALARCVFENGRYGLIDRQGRILLRDAAYISNFSEGMAAISLRGQLSGSTDPEKNVGLPQLAPYLRNWSSSVVLKDYTAYDQQFARLARLDCEGCRWGYVNTLGEITIDSRYPEFVGEFRQGRAIVTLPTGKGLIDRQGQYVINPLYRNIEPMRNQQNVLVYRLTNASHQLGLIDTLGREKLAATYAEKGEVSNNWVPVKGNNGWGYYQLEDGRQLPDTFLAAGGFQEGLAPVQLAQGWTLIDETGNRRWPNQFYSELGAVQDGRLWARMGNVWTLVDTSGIPVFSLDNADQAYDFEGGVARVIVDDKVGLVNQQGEWVLRPKFWRIDPFQANGRARVRLPGNPERWGLIDRQGQLLSSKGYRMMAGFSYGLALVQDQNGYGFIDGNGQETIACNLGPTRSFSEGLAVIQEFGKCGYIDVTGNQVVPPRYSNCLDFNGGLAVVYETMNSAGLINQSGAEVVEPSLNRLLHFQEGRGLVRDQQRGYYFVAQNTTLYDGYYDYARPYQHGVAIVGQEDKVGLINHKGIPLIRPKYGAISDFNNGLATVQIDFLYGLADADGRLILGVDYDYLAPASDGSIRVERGNKLGYLDFNGRWLWNLQE